MQRRFPAASNTYGSDAPFSQKIRNQKQSLIRHFKATVSNDLSIAPRTIQIAFVRRVYRYQNRRLDFVILPNAFPSLYVSQQLTTVERIPLFVLSPFFRHSVNSATLRY
jgi:hypothetical protein